MIKLIAVDIDGTLVNDKKEKSPDYFEIMDKMKEKGVMFAISSGRNYPSLIKLFPQNLEGTFFICENGAHIMYEGEEVAAMPMDMDDVNKVIEVCEGIDGISLIYETRFEQYMKKCPDKRFDMLRSFLPNNIYVDSLFGIGEAPLDLTIYDDFGAKTNCYQYLKDIELKNAKMVISGEAWLDVMHKDVDKGVALDIIKDRYNIKFEECAAFGDNYNDIEMLEKAYYGFAMKNAHEDIKSSARFVTEYDNNDFGVMIEIRKLLNI